MKFRYENNYDTKYERYYLFIKGLESCLWLKGAFDKNFFDKAVQGYKKQFEILK